MLFVHENQFQTHLEQTYLSESFRMIYAKIITHTLIINAAYYYLTEFFRYYLLV